MDDAIRVLHLEDDASDAELAGAMLESAGMACRITRVETHEGFRQALTEGRPDVILADYTLPAYDGVSALRLATELCSDVPFIFVSGTMGEDAAIEALTAGATDYVLKQRLSRLAPALKRALREAENGRQRRRAEESLRESERKLRAIFDHTFQFIGLMTPEGTLVEANRGALEAIGAGKGDVLGEPLWETPWWKHDAEMQEKVRVAVKAASEGQFVRFEASHRTSDGRLLYVDFSLTPVNDERGRVVLIIPEGRDVTERKLAEETDRRLAHIVESTDDAVIAKTLDGTILTWNGGAERLYGYSAEEVVGRPISILIPAEFPDELPLILARIRQGKRIAHYETTRMGKDGRRIEVSLCISPLADSRGTIVGASSIARDITERKRAETSLRESQRRQTQAERLAVVGRMAARAAQEINDPLARIRESFALVRDAVPADHPHRHMVERMESEIDRISHVVRQMYLLHPEEETRVADVAVGQAVKDVFARLEPLRRQRGVALNAGAVPRGLTVRLVEGGLQQVLYNLVANAVEASPDDGVVVVSAEPVHKGGEELLRISVRDRGHGIPAELQQRIFEPFFTTKSGDRSGEALGLGLSVVHSIVEAHGGSISLESTAGRGTVFHVFLPHSPRPKQR